MLATSHGKSRSKLAGIAAVVIVGLLAVTATFAFAKSPLISMLERASKPGKLRSGSVGQAVRVSRPRLSHLHRSHSHSPSPAPAPSPAPTPEPPATDAIAPQTTIDSGPPTETTATTASFTFSSSETGSSFECKLDAGIWSACTTPKTYAKVTLGSHAFSVRAIDAAKNVDATPATRAWTVEAESTPTPPSDTTPPQTTITSGPPATTAATSAGFTFSSSETGSSFECKLDSAAWRSCTTPKTYSGIAVGAHQFSVRAIDTAKNVDATPATQSWTVEEEEEEEVEEPTSPPSEEETTSPPPPDEECTTVVSSTTAAQSAVSSAPAGSVVCLANGSYGALALNATKAAPGVVMRAQNPGQATLASATLTGARLTLARFKVNGEVTIEPGTTGMVVDHNRITGGYMGVNAGPTSSTQINDAAITNNQLVGPFGEDAIRLNRYHDADGNGVGILIEGNEITGVRENGNHSDCLQAVWVGDHLVYRKNYLHDNRCQGFFVKDQASAIVGINVEDNLFVRDNEPCAPEAPGCGQPAYFQVFGPYSGFVMRRNTFWGGDQVATFQNGTGADTKIENNVIYRLWNNTNMSGITYANNTRCKRETSEGGSWPSSTPGETVNCSPAFNNPAADDLRLIDSDRGVEWAPAEQHYGP